MAMAPADSKKSQLLLPYFRSRAVRFTMLCGLAFGLGWLVLFSSTDFHPSFRPRPTPVGDETFAPVPLSDEVEELPVPVDIWAERAEQVKEAYLHAYRGYERYASPHDELLPLANGSIDKLVL